MVEWSSRVWKDTAWKNKKKDSKIIFSGDYFQTDLQKNGEKEGLGAFMSIVDAMEEFSVVEFTIGDIVRSGLVRSYLINKIKQGVEL